MAQYFVPTGDVSGGTAGTVASTDIGLPPTYYTEIDQGISGVGASADDSKYISVTYDQGFGPSYITCYMSGEGIEDPDPLKTNTMRLRARASFFGTDTLRVILDDGSRSETYFFSNVTPTSFSVTTVGLTGTYNWPSLEVRFQYETFDGETIDISEFEIELADPATGGGAVEDPTNPEAFLMFL